MKKIIDWIKENKKKVITAIIFFLSLIVVFFSYYQKVVGNNNTSRVKLISDVGDNLPQQRLAKNEIVTQNFMISKDFDGIQLKISTSKKSISGKLHVELLRTKAQKVIASWENDLNSYYKNKIYDFGLEKKEMLSDNTDYTIKIWTSDTNDEGDVFLYHSNGDGYLDGVSCVGETEQETDIIFVVYELQENAYAFIKPMYLIIITTVLLLFFSVYYLTFIKKVKIENIFLVLASGFGILYMIVMPPFSSPDEPIHFGTAYKISNEILGTQVVGESGYVVMRADDANVQYGTIPTVDTYQYTIENFNKAIENKDMTAWPNININSKNRITHIPGAIGITVGRLLNLGSIPVIYLGRITNLLFYLILVYFAIKIAPIGKMMFVSLSMTPMMLELISSYSYDAVVNGLAFLSIAYICSCIYEKSKIKIQDVIILACLAALLAPCKIVYSFVFVLCVFIPKDKFSKKKYYYLLLGLIVFMIIISNIYVNLGAVTSMSGTDASSSAIAEEQYSLMWCLKNPKAACSIYLHTTYVYGMYYFRTIFGGLLGWLEMHVPDMLIYMFACIALFSAFIKEDSKVTVKTVHRFFSLSIIVVTYVLVLSSMFFAWTPYGTGVILGVQGRYFLAVLPLFVIMLRNKKISLQRNVEKYLCLLLFVMNYTVLCHVFAIICSR